MEGSLISKLNYPQVFVLVLAWLVADLIAPLVIRFSFWVRAVDRPHTYKIHKEPIPLLGGLVIYAAFAVALVSILRFAEFYENKAVFSIVAGGCFVFILGLIDGFYSLHPVTKLGVLLWITYVLSNFGVRIQITGVEVLDLALTLFWIAGVTSAMNSLDNMDGVVTGTSAIASFWTFYVAWYSEQWGQPAVTYVAMAILGACFGFLRYNFKPARIFLGDNGSFLLGFLLATLMVFCGWSKSDPFKALIVPCSILAVPLFDITLSTVLRIKHGVVRSPWEAIAYCGRDHLSHRLIALGLSQREAVFVIYLFGTVSGAVGVIVAREEMRPALYLSILAVGILLLIAFGAVLNRAKVYSRPEAVMPPEPVPSSVLG